MSATRHTCMLIRYTAWANARLFDTLAGLVGSEVASAQPAIFASIIKTLNHAYVVDRIWQAHLESKPHGYTARNTEIQPALPDLRDAQQQIDQWYIACAEGLSETTQNEVVFFKFIDGNEGAMTRAEILLHVANHKTYHRGYVAQMLYQADARPPTMDLPVYLREAATELGKQ